MNQQELREAEYRCIQEEQPVCTGACPIHVNVRTICALLSAGDWEGAWTTLVTIMPLPRIVARICDHPCEGACRRREAGGTIAVSDLEKALVARIDRNVKVPNLPPRNLRVAVLGTGLSSLTAAWDLSRKGYRVVMLGPPDPCTTLFELFSPALLPRAAVEAEIAGLLAVGVELRTWEAPGKEEIEPNSLIKEFDALYVGLDERASAVRLPARAGMPDPVTFATGLEGLFAGGKGTSRKPFSPITDVSEGRRAALSIDRFLQHVSLTAGRTNEGVYRTRLYTSLAGVETEDRIRKGDPDGVYADREAAKEASRCIQCQCMECVKICLYLERFKSYPKRYIREIYNNETMLMGSHSHTNSLINSCTLCGLCAVVCPNNVSMADVCLEGRRNLVRRGKMPPPAHDFALDEMAFNNSGRFCLAGNEPGLQKSAYAFFPGCRLGGSSPEQVEDTYAFLRAKLKGGVGLMLRCCGAPAHWAGREDMFEAASEELNRQWDEMGRPVVIAACPTCRHTFATRFPEVQSTSLWEVFLETGLPAFDMGDRIPPAVAVHDPCTSRHYDEMQQAVRSLLRGIGLKVEDLDLSGAMTECCGYGGLVASADPSLARDVAERRGRESGADYVTYCSMCRDALRSAGTRCLHLLDILFRGPAAWDGAGQKGPGYSEQRENRSRLKERLILTLFGGEAETTSEHEKIVLHIAPDVLERMEERRILIEDVQRVIDFVRGGAGFLNKQTGQRLVSFTPRLVTYWVAYSEEGDGYRIHNTYSHRMVAARTQSTPGRAEKGAGEERWGCVECGIALAPAKVQLTYLGYAFTAELPACPRCGLAMVSEDAALHRIAEGEKLLEDK
jgi:glutamate synthase (NADPH) small chain